MSAVTEGKGIPKFAEASLNFFETVLEESYVHLWLSRGLVGDVKRRSLGVLGLFG